MGKITFREIRRWLEKYRLDPPRGTSIVKFRMSNVDFETRAMSMGFICILLLFPIAWWTKYSKVNGDLNGNFVDQFGLNTLDPAQNR